MSCTSPDPACGLLGQHNTHFDKLVHIVDVGRYGVALQETKAHHRGHRATMVWKR